MEGWLPGGAAPQGTVRASGTPAHGRRPSSLRSGGGCQWSAGGVRCEEADLGLSWLVGLTGSRILCIQKKIGQNLGQVHGLARLPSRPTTTRELN